MQNPWTKLNDFWDSEEGVKEWAKIAKWYSDLEPPKGITSGPAITHCLQGSKPEAISASIIPNIIRNPNTASETTAVCSHTWIMYTPFRGECFEICKHCNTEKSEYIKDLFKDDGLLPKGFVRTTEGHYLFGQEADAYNKKSIDNSPKPFSPETANKLVDKYYKGKKNDS